MANIAIPSPLAILKNAYTRAYQSSSVATCKLHQSPSTITLHPPYNRPLKAHATPPFYISQPPHSLSSEPIPIISCNCYLLKCALVLLHSYCMLNHCYWHSGCHPAHPTMAASYTYCSRFSIWCTLFWRCLAKYPKV